MEKNWDKEREELEKIAKILKQEGLIEDEEDEENVD